MGMFPPSGLRLFGLTSPVRYDVHPIPKPRMTRKDKWTKPPRPCVARYWAFKDKVRLANVRVPEPCKVTFWRPLADGFDDWDCRAHQETPDKDNLEKALLDALYGDDSHVWSVWVEKRWTKEQTGFITVEEIQMLQEISP